MFENDISLLYAHDMGIEFRQTYDEGYDIGAYRERCFTLAKNAAAGERGAKEDEARALGQRLLSAPMRADYEWVEPSELAEIKAQRNPELVHAAAALTAPVADSEIREKLRGAWRGRVAGCMLGKPVEGMRRPELHEVMRSANNFPLNRYLLLGDMPADKQEKYAWRAWADKFNGVAPWDDDTNYTVLYLKLTEQYGRKASSCDYLEGWLNNLPPFHTFTAERAAFRNAMRGMLPPETATHKNPFREWIGAQIRGDFFGYINPGNPEAAAEMAFRDAYITHIKNGIYGEMFAAAAIAAAYCTEDPVEVLRMGISQIPQRSRLYAAIEDIIAVYESGKPFEVAESLILSRWNDVESHDWCHTISNAMIVADALLYGGDYGKTICLAVQQGFDTDCNGATAGSIYGAMHGVGSIPSEWNEPIAKGCETTTIGCTFITEDEFVERAMAQVVR